MTTNSLHRYVLIALILLAAFVLRALDLQQYPPGVSRDEAINVVDGANIARSGNLPLYEEGWSRPEPTYRMVLALGSALFGPSVWALRLTTALVHLLALAAVGWMTAQILSDQPATVRRWGVLAALAFMAIMMTHISISRALYRAPLLLICSALSAGFVLRGLRTGRWRDFVLSGLFAGLNLYTYTAAWVFPGAFFGLGAALLLFQRSAWRRWLPHLLLLALVAALVALPVLLLAIQHPSAVLARTQDVSGENPLTAGVLRAAVGQFITSGDENPQYNAASQPLVPLLMLPFFLTGLLGLLIRIRVPSSLFLLALLLLFNIPVIISDEITHGLRIAGEFIVVPAIVAVGLVFVQRLVSMLPRGRWLANLTGGLFLVLITITGVHHWQIMAQFFDRADQWRQWRVHGRELDHNEWFFRTDRRDFAAWLIAQDSPLLLPLEEIARETTHAWMFVAYPTIQPADNSFQMPPDTRLVIPWSLEDGDLMRQARQFALLDQGTITILPPFSAETQRKLLATIDQGTPITRAGQIDFLGVEQSIAEGFTLEYESVQQRDLLASFGEADEVLLRRWYGVQTMRGQAGETLEFTPVWEPQRRVGHDYFALLQIQTQNYERITGTDVHLLRWLYPSSIWQAGDQVAESIALTLPADLAPGAYRLVTGLYFADYPPIAARSAVAESLPGTATIGWLKVPLAPISPPDQPALNIRFADQIALTHITLQQSADQWTAQLTWRSDQSRPDVDATIFVHLIDQNGAIIAQNDSRPLNGQYPTFIWDQGEVIRTEHLLGAVDLQGLALRIGMYVFPGPVNLPAEMNGIALADGLVLPGAALDFVTAP